MDKDKIEFKLKCIESEIEMVKQTSKWSKKTDKTLLAMGILTVIVVMFTTSSKESLHALDVFAISLLVCSLHKHITDMIITRNDDKHKLVMLDIDKRYYTSLLQLQNEAQGEEDNEIS